MAFSPLLINERRNNNRRFVLPVPNYPDLEVGDGLNSLMLTSGGLYPNSFILGGQTVYTDCGGNDNPGMSHCIRQSPTKNVTEFGIKNTTLDNRLGDREAGNDYIRRSESTTALFLTHGVLYTCAYTFSIFDFAAGQPGIVGQIHYEDTVDGSPAYATRITADGKLRITSRAVGQAGNGTTVYQSSSPLTLTASQDIVIEQSYGLTPGVGHLKVWHNGVLLCNLDVSNGSADTGLGGYWKIGGYWSAGFPVGADYQRIRIANYIPHGSTNMSSRIATPLTIPTPA